MSKYKLEKWTLIKWKGTKRETQKTVLRFVQRDEKGHFKKVITDVREQFTDDTIYISGYYKGERIIRKLKERRQVWVDTTGQKPKETGIYRTSYVLNNIPISKNGYFGFRIVCFSTNKEYLFSLKEKMKQKLIKWIEKCIKYNKDEFWFDMYFGYESPSLNNASLSENNKYYTTMENRYGTVIKEDYGELNRL